MTGSNLKTKHLCWIDIETTGLDLETCKILEVAVVITDQHLREVAEFNVVTYQSDLVLRAMNEWCTKQHTGSGLVQEVKDASVGVLQAEKMILEFLQKHLEENQSPMCGSSIGFDSKFLERYMPSVHAFLHYRRIDVSTVKELVRRWYPQVESPKKEGAHRALADIRDSIEELDFYWTQVFRDL